MEFQGVAWDFRDVPEDFMEFQGVTEESQVGFRDFLGVPEVLHAPMGTPGFSRPFKSVIGVLQDGFRRIPKGVQGRTKVIQEVSSSTGVL